MELSKKDAYLVLRTAYKTGLLKKMTTKEPKEEVHIPGTSYTEFEKDNFDMALTEEYGRFLAELIDTVRREEKA